MRKQSFILSALILALGGFLAKAIGALYKIPLANILGSSGMGIYYLIFPIYSLLISLSSSGVAVALSTEVAKCRKIRHRYNEQKLLRVALVISFIISLIFTIFVVVFAKKIAELQGNINAFRGYIIISPAIIISTMIATLRGYFQGVENMIPTTISMIIEQIVKLSIGLVLAHYLCRLGIEFAVMGAILGVTLSEVVAFIIIAINFFTYKGQLYYNYRNLNYKTRRRIKINSLLKNKSKLKKSNSKPYNYLKCSSVRNRFTTKVAINKILKVSIPATFSNLIIPIATMLDSFMIINILISSGYTSFVSTSLYGLWGGVVQSLISLPTIIVAGISTSLVPSLSGLIVRNDTNEIKHKVEFFIKLTWVLSIIMFVLIYCFSGEILEFLYGDGLSKEVIDEMYYAIKMLKFSSVSIIYYSFLQTFSAILQSIGKSYVPFVSLLIAIVIRTILIYTLVSIPNINIFGGIIANILFLSIACILCAWHIGKIIKLSFKLWRHLLLPLLIGVIILIITEIIDWAIEPLLSYFSAMIISGIICVVAYVFVVFFSRIFNEKELKTLQFKKNKISKIK